MAYPNATETVRDGGLGLGAASVFLPVVLGRTSIGAINSFELYSTPSELVAARGQGPGVETAAKLLSEAGGPVALVCPATSVAGAVERTVGTYVTPGTNGSITRVGSSGPAISVAGPPSRAALMRVEITTGGTVGVAVFRFSEDGGSTWVLSGIVTAATVLLGTTGITATFPAGTYVSGETYSWTASVTGGSVAGSGTVTLDAHVRLECVGAGGLGAGKFKYSCDDFSGSTVSERTYSEDIVIPSGGVFVIPHLELTLTFSGTFVVGDRYEIDVECPSWNATDLANAFAPLTSTIEPWRFVAAVATRANGDTAAHATLGAALQAQLVTLQNQSVYRAGMVAADQGENTPAQAVTAWVNTVTPRCLVAYGRVQRSTPKPFAGFSRPVTHGLDCFAARGAKALPSTDLKRVLDGPLEGVFKIFHDERVTPTSLDTAKISTLATFRGRRGFFIGQARINSATGSDFKYWPHRILMDLACEIAHDASLDFIGRGLRTNPAGSTDPNARPGAVDSAERAAMKLYVETRLSAVLLEQENAEGTRGFVQALRYLVDPVWNVRQTGIVRASVGIRPFDYVDLVETVLGFDASLAA